MQNLYKNEQRWAETIGIHGQLPFQKNATTYTGMCKNNTNNTAKTMQKQCKQQCKNNTKNNAKTIQKLCKKTYKQQCKK